MGLTSKIGRIAGRGFLKGVFRPLLRPVAAMFTAVTIVPTFLAVSVLWGMTTKGQNEQAWGLSDYAVVLGLSWVIARSGRINMGMGVLS